MNLNFIKLCECSQKTLCDSVCFPCTSRSLTASLQQHLAQSQERVSGLEVHKGQLEVQVQMLLQTKDVLQGEAGRGI